MIKRQMYGRASLALLRKRIILHTENTDHGIRSRAQNFASEPITLASDIIIGLGSGVVLLWSRASDYGLRSWSARWCEFLAAIDPALLDRSAGAARPGRPAGRQLRLV